jgi:hypothetical protein
MRRLSVARQKRIGEGALVTDLLLKSITGNPSQYEVIADEQIVGRIALYSALRVLSETTGSPGSGLLILRSVLAVSGCMASRRGAKPRWKPSLDAGSGTGEVIPPQLKAPILKKVSPELLTLAARF